MPMNELPEQMDQPFPTFTHRARHALLRANRLSAQTRCENVGSLLLTVAVIESDDEIRGVLPALTFDTEALLESLQDVIQLDDGRSAKAMIVRAVSLAEPSRSPVDTLHFLKAAMIDPGTAVIEMLSALDVAAVDILPAIEELLDRR